MKTQLISFTALLICAWSFFPSVVRATLVPIAITAEVTYLDDDDDLLEGNINVGDIITGVYIYDSSTPDSQPEEYRGTYRYYAPPAGITLTVSGFVFMTDPDNVEFTMRITNDSPPPLGGDGGDGYSLSSKNNLPLPNGASVTYLQLSLHDSSSNALSSDALPTTAPVLDDWEMQRIDITGRVLVSGREYHRYSIEGNLTSAVLIPEPATVILVGLGGFALLRKGKRMGL